MKLLDLGKIQLPITVSKDAVLRELKRFGLELWFTQNIWIWPGKMVDLTGKNGGFDQEDGFNKGTYSDFTG